MRPKAVMSWSSGKDSAFALHEIRQKGEVEVVGLLTTVTSAFGRVSMHGVREALLDRQAEALGLPSWKVPIPSPCPNEIYEREMARVLVELRRLGVNHVVFGDLFLEDLRRYREARLAELGMSAVFPLWMRDTAALAKEMVT
jgi:diphthamide synthase (EF-2-diphthine--ammonia ligase)